jgi:hypothetical protein
MSFCRKGFEKREDQMKKKMTMGLIFGALSIFAAGHAARGQALYSGNVPLAQSSISNVPASSNGLPASSVTNNSLTNGAITAQSNGTFVTPSNGTFVTPLSSTSPAAVGENANFGTTPSTLNNGTTTPDTGLNYGNSSTSTNQPSNGIVGYGLPILTGPGETGGTVSGSAPGTAQGSSSGYSSGAAPGASQGVVR